MAIEIVDFPINSMVDLSIVMLVCLPEGKPPFSYGFPMVFPFSHGFPMVFPFSPWFSYGFPFNPSHPLTSTLRSLPAPLVPPAPPLDTSRTEPRDTVTTAPAPLVAPSLRATKPRTAPSQIRPTFSTSFFHYYTIHNNTLW